MHRIFLFNAKIIKTNNIRNAYLHPLLGFLLVVTIFVTNNLKTILLCAKKFT
nr:MAG TPA: hypothetical protein [Caudoviricetes sp.]